MLRPDRIDLDDRGAKLDEDTSTRGAGDDVAQVDTVKPASGAFVATPGSIVGGAWRVGVLRTGVLRIGRAPARRQDSSAGYGCALAIQADRPICGVALPRTSAKIPAACAFGSLFHSSQL
jgi:hypothetical protein